MKKVKILGVSSYLPKQTVSSVDLFEDIKSEQQYGVPKDWMNENMGIIERRISEGMTPSQLAIPASNKAIINAGLTTNDIDAVIFCGIERDRPEPATAHYIANNLGINSKHSFDMANACFGFIEGINVAKGLIQSGCSTHVLVCTGEIPSKVLFSAIKRLKKGVSPSIFKKYIGGLSVGDAGGAVVLSASEDNSGIDCFNTVIKTRYVNHCYYHISDDGDIDGEMRMGQLAAATIKTHNDLFKKTQQDMQWEKPDYLISHQVGRRPYERLSHLMLDNHNNHMKIYDYLGNIASASLPLGFEKLIKSGTLSKGDQVLGCFNGSGAVAGQLGYTI